MRNAFDGLISSMDMAKERISEAEDGLIETSQTEVQREKIMQKKNLKNPRTVEQFQNI